MQDYPSISLFWLWWILATTVGFSGGTAIAMVTTEDPNQILVLAGMVGGIAQWLVLRNRLRGAYWWIPATVLGLLLGSGFGIGALFLSLGFGLGAGMVSPGIAMPGPLSVAVGLAAVGAVLGAAQWLVLAKQIRGAGFWILGMMLSCPMGGLLGLYLINLSSLKDLGENGLMLGSAIAISTTMSLITGYWLNSALRLP